MKYWKLSEHWKLRNLNAMINPNSIPRTHYHNTGQCYFTSRGPNPVLGKDIRINKPCSRNIKAPYVIETWNDRKNLFQHFSYMRYVNRYEEMLFASGKDGNHNTYVISMLYYPRIVTVAMIPNFGKISIATHHNRARSFLRACRGGYDYPQLNLY